MGPFLAVHHLVKYEHRRTLKRVLQKYKGERIVVLPHNFPDWDGATSAAVLARAMGWTFSLQPPMEASVLNGIRKLGFEFLKFSELDPANFDGLVLVDGNSISMFPPSILNWNVRLVIDHHKRSDGIHTKNKIIIPEAEATARIIAELINGAKDDRIMATALAAGIYSDTVKLGVVRDPNIFPVFAELLRIGRIGNIELSRLVDPIPTEEELRAISHARMSIQIETYKGIRIATAICDRTIQRRIAEQLSQEHHIVIVGSNGTSEQRLTLRVYEPVQIDGSEIMRLTGRIHNGSGGGHEKAAGCGGNGTLDEMTHTAVVLIKEQLDRLEKVIIED